MSEPSPRKSSGLDRLCNVLVALGLCAVLFFGGSSIYAEYSAEVAEENASSDSLSDEETFSAEQNYETFTEAPVEAVPQDTSVEEEVDTILSAEETVDSLTTTTPEHHKTHAASDSTHHVHTDSIAH